MGDKNLPPLMEYFNNVEDPRRETKNKKYPLIEVIVIAFLAVMSGADGWESIERYGEMRKKWLGKFLALKEGIPKHDVYRRVFCALRSELLETCFMNWVRDIKQEIWREVIAIDGKTVRGMATKSRFKAGTEANSIHLVSAWTENQLVFAQVKTAEKSNEITAIPILLEQIAIAGCIVTIDAMGCQHEIADKIVAKEADFVFSLKGNQGTLYEQVKEYRDMLDFNKPEAQAKYIKFRTLSTYDEKHGRKETRDYAVSDDVAWLLEQFPQWKTIKSIGLVESTRDTGGDCKTERRYFISSLEADEELFAHAVRAHWGIENRLHYMLDVVYREDACRVRKDHSPRTLALIRKIALTIARSDKESKTSIRGRVQQMTWSEDYLERLLFHSGFVTGKEAS